MDYKKIIKGTFIKRPNRFIAHVNINGSEEKVHVKNTGRCKELLVPGAKVILEDCRDNPSRKTGYSLIGVYKKDLLINMDSQVPNKVVFDAIKENKLKELGQVEKLKREVTYKNSRFDIYFEKDGVKSFLEVKGVTLEKNGIAMFPDAPTKRGTKHILELIEAKEEGYGAYIFFLIQMEKVDSFRPNTTMDPDFSKALKLAYDKGVNILVYNSSLTESSIEILKEISFTLS